MVTKQKLNAYKYNPIRICWLTYIMMNMWINDLVNVSFVKKESRVHYIVIHFSKQHVEMLQICGHVLLMVDQLSLICYAFWFLCLKKKKAIQKRKRRSQLSNINSPLNPLPVVLIHTMISASARQGHMVPSSNNILRGYFITLPQFKISHRLLMHPHH